MTVTSIPAAMPGLIAGMLSDTSLAKDAVPKKNGDTVPLVPGLFVKQGTADDDVKAPTGPTNLLVGVALFSHAYAPGVQLDLTSGGYLPGITFDVLRKGRVPVTAGAAMVPGNAVHVQVIADAGYAVGVVRPDADAGKSIDVSAFVSVQESGDATNPPVIEIDMANAHTAVAD